MSQTNQTQQYPIHPYANALPAMSGEELEALKASIQRNGQKVPILIYDGQILDGRNRYRACLDLGIRPKVEIWTGTPDQALSEVMAVNVNRRHLTTSQRALLAAKASPLAPGQRRQKEDGSATRTLSQREAAKLFIVSRDSVQTARQLLNSGNAALIAEVERGQCSIHAAKELLLSEKVGQVLNFRDRQAMKRSADIKAERRERARQERIVTVKALNGRAGSLDVGDKNYALMLADPPWDYGERESGSSHDIQRHYRTMKTEDICALHVGDRPVKDIVAPVATLFLWCPASMLKDGIAVLEAWGFDYTTCAVWHKQGGRKPNHGGVFYVHHELILIGHRRGGLPKPGTSEMVPSVFVAPVSDHSVKPLELHETLERYYPDFADSRIELFAREPREGWDAWGDQADGATVEELLEAA